MKKLSSIEDVIAVTFFLDLVFDPQQGNFCFCFNVMGNLDYWFLPKKLSLLKKIRTLKDKIPISNNFDCKIIPPHL